MSSKQQEGNQHGGGANHICRLSGTVQDRGAVDPAPADRDWFPAALTAFCGQSLQRRFQFRIVGQNRFPKVAAHGAVGVTDTKHGAFAFQRQAAVLTVIVGTASSHQFSDGASFLRV